MGMADDYQKLRSGEEPEVAEIDYNAVNVTVGPGLWDNATEPPAPCPRCDGICYWTDFRDRLHCEKCDPGTKRSTRQLQYSIWWHAKHGKEKQTYGRD